VASHASDFAFLVATARRGIEDLQRALRRVPLSEGERGSQFVIAAEALLLAISDGVDKRESEFAEGGDETDKESLVRAVRQITHDIRNVHFTTPWIDAAQNSRLPAGLIYFVDEMAAALVKASPDVIAVPTPKYMYETHYKPFTPELEALQHEYPDVFPVIIHYPAQENDSLLLHLLIAHELGHSAVRRHDLIATVASRASDPAQIERSLGEAVEAVIALESTNSSDATLAVGDCFVKWLTEALCDGLALAFLGPSFLLSAAAFLMPLSGPRPSPTHPPNNIRTELLFRYIQQWGWRPLLEDEAPEILRWLEETAAEAMDTAGKTYYETIGQLVLDLAPAVESTVAEHLGNKLFLPETYAEQAEEIAALLDSAILPAQHLDGAPTDRRSVILGGWLHALREKGATPDKLPEVFGEREFEAFLAKALEMSAVLQRWREVA
jgi:hypothetical protein